MTIRNISEAKAELSALLVLVENGEEVLIAKAGKPIARLTKVHRPTLPRTLGLMSGQFELSSDFNQDAEIETLFYSSSIEPSA